MRCHRVGVALRIPVFYARFRPERLLVMLPHGFNAMLDALAAQRAKERLVPVTRSELVREVLVAEAKAQGIAGWVSA